MGSEYFLRSDFTSAVLKESRKVPSIIQKLIKVVIGRSRESMQDLRSLVGMRSRGQVEFEDDMIAFRTSSRVAGAKSESRGGGKGGGGLRESREIEVTGINRVQSLVTLSLKN